ncbi:creatininase family protein [Candidatus Bathyarchaeota archaeon]|nr:creatininase family protein [Candidatus Bathyarchaeota archaeon]
MPPEWFFQVFTMSDDVLYEVRGPKTLFEMTRPEVEELLKHTETVVIPVGSTEQHGTHLPLGSDTMQGDDMAKRLIKKFADNGVAITATPTFPFGISDAHMKFPGSITISSRTLMTVLTEVVQSLYHHGFRKFVLLLSHGGNLPTLRLLANDLVLEYPDIKVIVPDWIPINSAAYPQILNSSRPNDEHHSGEGETARMLAYTPKLVDMANAESYYMEPIMDPYQRKPYPGSVSTATSGLTVKEMTPYGVMGSPLKATAEAGNKLYEVITDWLYKVMKYEFDL